jgi:hypothetical protein
MKTIEIITEKLSADKSLMKYFNNDRFYDAERFISDANNYIQAIKTGRMFCIIKSVSTSGKSRVIKFNSTEINKENNCYYRQYNCFFLALGYKEGRKGDGFPISGCGMNMIFHTNYSIIHKLTKLGFLTKSECEKLCQQTPTCL